MTSDEKYNIIMEMIQECNLLEKVFNAGIEPQWLTTCLADYLGVSCIFEAQKYGDDPSVLIEDNKQRLDRILSKWRDGFPPFDDMNTSRIN